MKILIIPSWYYDYDTGKGGLALVNRQARVLQSLGARVCVLFADLKLYHPLKAKYSITTENGVKTFRKKQFLLPRKSRYLVDLWIRTFENLFYKFEEDLGAFDIIHAHGYLAGCVARNISIKLKVPYLITEHSSDFLLHTISRLRKKYVHYAFKDAAYVVAVSRSLAENLKVYTDKNKIMVIPNHIDTSFFCPSDRIEKRDKDIFTYLTVGSPVHDKGLDLLVRAFSIVQKKSRKEQRLLLVDNIKGKETLIRLIKRYNVKGIKFLGFLEAEHLRKIYRDSDVYVSSSRFESFGMTMTEAIACGKPVIATETAGAKDIIDKKCGILIPTNDHYALADAMESMMNTYNQYAPYELYEYVANHFGNEMVGEIITDLYRKMLDKG